MQTLAEARKSLESHSFDYGSTADIVNSVTLLQDLSKKASAWSAEMEVRARDRLSWLSAAGLSRLCVLADANDGGAAAAPPALPLPLQLDLGRQPQGKCLGVALRASGLFFGCTSRK